MKSAGQRLSSPEKYRMFLSAVHMVYRLVNSTYNVKELSLRMTRLLCQCLGASSAKVFLLDLKKQKVSLIAIFNNKINILLEKRKELQHMTAKEKKVAQGYAIFEKRLIGLPLVADEIIGAMTIQRSKHQRPFGDFERDLLSVFVEQSVMAIKNLQLYESQQRAILSSIKFISNLLKKRGYRTVEHTPVYFNIVKCLAEKMKMSGQGIESLYYASVLHDAGILDVPYEILAKRSQLTSEDFKVIRDLPSKSAELIRPVEFLRPVLPIILYHKEKYDGTGYPSGLKKTQIPLGARIMAVVDAFESMLGGRPYKERLTIPRAFEELKANSGTQFDPQVVKAFCDLYKKKRFCNYLRKMHKSPSS